MQRLECLSLINRRTGHLEHPHRTRWYRQSMARLWTRFREWICPREWESDKNPNQRPLEVHLQRAAWAPEQLLRRHLSINEQRALPKKNEVSREERSTGDVRRQRSQSLPYFSRDPGILLRGPEHQLARARQQYINDAVPEDLQRSRVSCNLHDLTQSDEAGRRHYSEDVAERNMKSRASSFTALPKAYLPSGSRPCVNRTSSPPIEEGLWLSWINERAASRPSPPASRQHHAGPQIKFVDASVAGRKTRSMHAQPSDQLWQAVATEKRRHSLTHKPNIFDLRNTFEISRSSGPGTSPRRYHSGSQQSRRSSITRSRLDMPLPPTPVTVFGDNLVHKTRSQQPHQERWNVPSLQATPSAVPLSLSRSEGTTFDERWAPAVTHETITRNVHEIREEHIHKEIHNYQIHHKVQPVVEYEILPARHFVCVDGVYRELNEKDLPLGTPNTEWFVAEVASKLESIRPEEVCQDSYRHGSPEFRLTQCQSSQQ